MRATLQLVMRGTTPVVTISLEQEPDALSHEHERDHRDLVRRVLGIDPNTVKIEVTRTAPLRPVARALPELPEPEAAPAPLLGIPSAEPMRTRGNPGTKSRGGLGRFLRGR